MPRMGRTGSDTGFWRRVRHALEEALDREGDDRAAFLAAYCDGDDELRSEVDRLLALESSPGPDLDPPTPTAFHGLLPDAPAGGLRRVGPYEVVRELGSGGMGTVWLAERTDGAFSRQVAIKVLRPGLATAAVLARFQRERQLLAELDHPGIARLYEGGQTEDGLPYLVMEHVDGAPIDRWADERQLTTSERIELFRKVCAAVHGAHQRLIVHRDLKPSNILVGADGEPKLLDFGIAKMLDPGHDEGGELTLPEHRAMTPAYASPEQVTGAAITTASDVYSLGVVLYRLLTGDLPHRVETSALPEIERLLSREPTRPSTAVLRADADAVRARRATARGLQRALEGDLDHIVLMALRREPERRYASVAELADDLGHHLDGLPVRARPDTLLYRTSKFVTRNRWAVAAGVLVFALLSAGLVFSTLQYRRADEAGRLEADARGLAERRLLEVRRLAGDLEGQRAKTEERLVQVEALNVELEQQRAAAEERFQDAYSLAKTLTLDVARDLIGIPGARDVVERIMGEGQPHLDRLTELAQDERMMRELALSYLRLGQLRGSTSVVGRGTIGEAAGYIGRAVELGEELVLRAAEDDRNPYTLVRCLNERAGLLRAEGRWDEARADLERALEVGQGLAQEQDIKPGYAYSLQATHYQLARCEGMAGNFPRAEELLDLGEEYLRRSPGFPRRALLTELAGNEEFRGAIASSRGEHEAAVAAYERAVRQIAELLEDAPDDVFLRDHHASLQLDLAVAMLGLGPAEAALPALERCLEDAEQVLLREPRHIVARRRKASCHESLARAHGELDDLAQAAEAHALEIEERRALASHDERDTMSVLLLAGALRRAADTARLRGRHDEVDGLVDEGLDLTTRHDEVFGMRTEGANLTLVAARSLRDRGARAEALEQYDECIARFSQRAPGWEGDNVLSVLETAREERAELAERPAD